MILDNVCFNGMNLALYGVITLMITHPYPKNKITQSVFNLYPKNEEEASVKHLCFKIPDVYFYWKYLTLYVMISFMIKHPCPEN